MQPITESLSPRRGRPRKFARPSHAVTLTLPNEVIEALAAVDADLSRAVVRVMQPELAKRPHPPAELTAFGRHAVIVVNPSRTLERRTGVVLVPMADGRALISFDEPKTVAELELQIQDLLDDGQLTATDQRIFQEISSILREARRADGVVVHRRHIIVLETGRARAGASAAAHQKHLEQKSLEQESLQEESDREAVENPVVGGGRCPVSHRRLWRELRAERAGPGCRQRRRTRPRRPGERGAARHPEADFDRAQRDIRPDGRANVRIPGVRQYRLHRGNDLEHPGFAATIGRTAVPEGTGGKTSFTPDSDLQPTTLFYWRARAVQGTTTSAWSATGTFRSKLVGFLRAGELYDPLIHGETVGERVGSTTFIPGKGIQLNDGQSWVKYLLPQTITSGEFSMDVEGLRANAPGDKTKVLGMQEGQDDFITNEFRVDIQYRGTAGFPPNAITFRALYGDGEDLESQVRAGHGHAVRLDIPAEPVDDLSLEDHLGERVPPRRARGRSRRVPDLQRRDADERAPTPRFRTTRTSARRWAAAAASRRASPGPSTATSG